MTPKEKALQLMEKAIPLAHADWSDSLGFVQKSLNKNAKGISLLVVDEVLELEDFSVEGRKFWSEVKEELTTPMKQKTPPMTDNEKP